MTRYVGPIKRVNRGRGHSYVDQNGEKVPGVTTTMSAGIPKPALMNWGPQVTAEYAVDHWDELADKKPSARLAELTKARYAVRDAAANKGSRVHALAEQLVADKKVKVPDDIAGHVEAYVQFLNEWEPRAVLIEAVVVSHKHSYAGTMDLAAEFDPEMLLDCGIATDDLELAALLGQLADAGEPALAILDIKTSRSGIFGETALQLACYRLAEKYVDTDGNEQDMPEFHLALGLHVRGDGYSLMPITAGPEQQREWLYAREMARFVNETSKTYIGAPLISPKRVQLRRLEVVEEPTF